MKAIAQEPYHNVEEDKFFISDIRKPDGEARRASVCSHHTCFVSRQTHHVFGNSTLALLLQLSILLGRLHVGTICSIVSDINMVRGIHIPKAHFMEAITAS
jgi:hypothetical protein